MKPHLFMPTLPLKSDKATWPHAALYPHGRLHPSFGIMQRGHQLAFDLRAEKGAGIRAPLELAYLRLRSHHNEFWGYAATLMPGWDTAKAWLGKHQSALSAKFLNACSAKRRLPARPVRR